MNRKFFRAFLILLLTVGLTSLSFAQRQTGSIHGTVLDEEKSPLPGATVTISGPALQGTRSYVTLDTGTFRFPALSPGTYDLKVEIPGFKTEIRKGLICNIGKTTEVTIQLTVAAVEEQITVVATSPVVDIEASKLSVNYGAEFLASIPMNRDLYDIQNSLPGAISEGADYRRTSSILGGTVRSQLYALDGVPMNDPATFYSMANINVEVYEEMEVELVAHPAEVGQTDSTYINIVTKSGGNKFSGGASVLYSGAGWGQDLFTNDQLKALGVNPPEKYSNYQDYTLNLGGPFIEDRLWFYLNGRRQTWGQVNPYTPESRMARLGLTSPHYDLEHQEWMGFAKLTFQIAKDIKYMGMLHYNHIYEPVYSNSIGSDVSYDNTEIWDHENTYTTTHQFNWILDQNTFLDVRGTYIRRYFPIHSLTQNQYTYYDYNQSVYWGASPYNDEYVRKKILFSASMTKFLDNFLLGTNHELKAGFEFEQTEYHRDWYRENPYYSYYRDYTTRNPYYYSTTTRYGRLRVRTCPPERGMWDVQDHTRRFSGYFQDSISRGRLTFNLGLRYDFSYQYEPEQTRPELRFNVGPEQLNPAITNPNALLEALIAQYYTDTGDPYSPFDELTTPYKRPVEFSTFSPRIGAVYDIFGDGKTALKLSYSRYYEPVWSAKYNACQIFGASSINWEWRDLNANRLMDLPPTDAYRLTSYSIQDPEYFYYYTWESIQEAMKSGDLTKLEKGVNPPHMDEVMVGVERELFKDFKLGLSFLYRRYKSIVEDIDLYNGYHVDATDATGLIWLPFTFTDPGWDGNWNTTADNKEMTVYGLRADRPIQTWVGTNPPEAKREYTALILTFDKRMSNKWQLNGSILYSSYKGNAEATYSPTEGESTMFDNPNTLVNGYGPIWFDRPLQIKIMGTYILPYDIIVSAYVRYQSGSPWQRTFARVYFPLGFGAQQTYIDVNADPRGSRRYREYINLDFRLEKEFSFSDFGRLTFYIDIFNLGAYSGININQDPAARLRFDRPPLDPTDYELSPTYRLVTSVTGVRSMRLGLRWTF